jgi:hypothetical protein
MRDDWMDLTSYDSGASSFEIGHDMFVDRLKYLPGNSIEGNQTLIVRAIKDTNSSANEVVHIHIMNAMDLPIIEEDSPSLSFGFVIFTSMMVALFKTRRVE